MHKLVSECSNMQSKNISTGCLINNKDFVRNNRVQCLDLSRQEVFEVDPNVSQAIRLGGRSV